ncbi:uncharacterized protein LOC144432392 [Styela clava]
MRIVLLLCIAACAAVCVTGSSRKLPSLPPCSVKSLPSKRPKSCQKDKKSKCEEKKCYFNIKKGILTENGKSKAVNIVKEFIVNGSECDKQHWNGLIKRCSSGIIPCRCRNWGVKTWIKAWISEKKDGKWMSVKKPVKVNIPAGCMCAEQNILTRSL